MQTIDLTNDQRRTLVEVLGVEESRLRESSVPLLELAEKAAILVRIAGTCGAPLTETDGHSLVVALERHRAEALEKVTAGEADRRKYEQGDEGYGFHGLSREGNLAEYDHQIDGAGQRSPLPGSHSGGLRRRLAGGSMTALIDKAIPLPAEMAAMLRTTVEGLLLEVDPEVDLALLRDAAAAEAYGKRLMLVGGLQRIAAEGRLELDEVDLDEKLDECIRHARESAEENRKDDPDGHGEDFVMAQARLFQMEGLRGITQMQGRGGRG